MLYRLWKTGDCGLWTLAKPCFALYATRICAQDKPHHSSDGGGLFALFSNPPMGIWRKNGFLLPVQPSMNWRCLYPGIDEGGRHRKMFYPFYYQATFGKAWWIIKPKQGKLWSTKAVICWLLSSSTGSQKQKNFIQVTCFMGAWPNGIYIFATTKKIILKKKKKKRGAS